MAEITTPIDLSALDYFGDTATILRLMEPHIKAALGIVKGAVRDKTPVGSKGLLRQSIALSYDFAKGEGRVYVYGRADEYAPFVEYGRMPGKFPPWGVGTPLYEWVKVKVRSAEYSAKSTKPRPTHKTRTSKGVKTVVMTEEGKRILSISFLIARAIARRGTFADKGAPHMFELAWMETGDQALDIIQAGIIDVIKKLAS